MQKKSLSHEEMSSLGGRATVAKLGPAGMKELSKKAVKRRRELAEERAKKRKTFESGHGH